MESVLNFDQPLDVGLFDKVVQGLYCGDQVQMQQSHGILEQFRNHPSAWTRVDTILEYSQFAETKYLALQIIENVINTKWKILPKQQRDGIQNYIVNLAIKISSDANTLHAQPLFISKLDLILVQIIKQEWPRNWEGFIPEIVGASRTNESLCENNMTILRLMSEEVFDFSKEQMVELKVKELKENFHKQFFMVYELCETVLENSQNTTLLANTLQTLHKFLNWIPLGYIFDTKMTSVLIFKFLPIPAFRNSAIQCLTEIGSLTIGPEHEHHFEKLFIDTMNQVVNILPPNVDISEAYETFDQEEADFVQHLALFLCGFFKAHLSSVEKMEHQNHLLEAHNYLTKISYVDDEEIFKICLDYWLKLSYDFFRESTVQPSLLLGGGVAGGASPRRQLYAPIFTRVRLALIRRMPKPEEVLIVEDENGNIVRERLPDTDAIIQYKTMRETLVYLTCLDPDDTQKIMLKKLANQVNGTEWSRHNLNTLCWAIGAISGAQSDDYEKRFLVTVIRDLLGLCDIKRGKDNKAVVASNIMYVVGQYPSFLRAHWNFLKTVVRKLFEFMHELHEGVQDMACDTFLKISQKCRRKFAVVLPGERDCFVVEILNDLPTIIEDLENHQIHTFYEAVGYMIAAHPNEQQQGVLVSKLMEVPNQIWTGFMQQAQQNMAFLQQPDVLRNMDNILKTNIRACYSLGQAYVTQLGRFFLDLMNVYRAYSEMIMTTVSNGGPNAALMPVVRHMRAIKRNTLKLLETFVERSDDLGIFMSNFMAPLFDTILVDYCKCLPDTKDSEVLSLLTAIINKFQQQMTQEVPRILANTFECTLGMLTNNFEDYPDLRSQFFKLLRAIQAHCCAALFSMPQAHFKLVVDAVVWAFQHTERNISETGLTVLLEMLKNVEAAGRDVEGDFYKSYFLKLLQDVFYVLTDTFHKAGFKLQSRILQHMFSMTEPGRLLVPLYDESNPPSMGDPTWNNRLFVKNFMVQALTSAFQNLTMRQVQLFVDGLFERLHDFGSFKQHLRDFLIQLKEFSSDNEDLYLEERENQERMLREQEKQRLLNNPALMHPMERPDMEDYS